jgi:general stress protein YciG
MATEDRGFASMDPEEQREIARKGGQSQGKENNPGNFANRDPEDVRKAAHEGGMSQGMENNPGNFANDREKAREAGRKGGERSHGGRGDEEM